jgi:hypothetical protein
MSGSVCLAKETVADSFSGVRPQQLDSGCPPQRDICGPIDLAHSSGAEELLQAVV